MQYYTDMWWTGINSAKENGFVGFASIGDLRKTGLRDVPKQPGVYLILRTAKESPVFLTASRGGHFKGKDPAVNGSVLIEKWVEGSHVVYVGKAGQKGKKATLRSRLTQYIQFGAGKPVGHWGGRYIWQLEGCEELIVAWKVLEEESPLEVEQKMLDEFYAVLRKLPFANCRR